MLRKDYDNEVSDHFGADDSDIPERPVSAGLTVGLYFRYRINHIHPPDHFTEDRVFYIQVIIVDEVDKELGPPVSGPELAIATVPRLFRLFEENSSLMA